MKKDTTKYTLLTNIDFVHLLDIGMRLDAHAILIEENVPAIFGEGVYHRMRGFGVDSAWSVFTYWLKPEQLPYAIVSASDQSKVFLKDDGSTKPLFSGNTLTLADGKQFFLQSQNIERDIDITTRETDICKIWEILEEKCQQYWSFPNIPMLHYVPHLRSVR